MTNLSIEKRINEAVEDGEQAFWTAVAEKFHEAQYGDLAPDDVFTLVSAMKKAVQAWVETNVVQSED